MTINNETKGPAETIIQTLMPHVGHMRHNRPGVVVSDPRNPTGVEWKFCTHRVEDGKKVIYLVTKGRSPNVRLGTLWADNTVRRDDRTKVGRYLRSGLVPEVASWIYRQVADLWRMDNEILARWASFAYRSEHKDLKVVLAAFSLVQSRKGDPIKEDDKVLFFDWDYRNVGEAMALLDGPHSLDAKLILRIHEVLTLKEVAEINYELGFGRSKRTPFLGRWPKMVTRWLRYRENNPNFLRGLVSSGNKENVKELCRLARYKPQSPRFFRVLGWDQKQANGGHREVAVGQTFAGATWEGKTEEEICETIMREKPNYDRIVSLVPKDLGVTRAIVAAAVEAGSFSDKYLIMSTPTLESLGLLQVQEVRAKYEQALRRVEDQRAAHIARNVRSKELREKLEDASEKAAQKAVEEVLREIELYFFVDTSSSMLPAIEAAKSYIEKFLPAFPLDKIHVAVFKTIGREIIIPHRSKAGVQQAFVGISASGGTSYASGVRALQHIQPKENSDVLFFFIGDEEDFGGHQPLVDAVRISGLEPSAFGLIRLRNSSRMVVQEAAAELGIPCFRVDEAIFEDPYAVPRTLRNLIASTPVGAKVSSTVVRPRATLMDQILQTELLKKPAWASAVG